MMQLELIASTRTFSERDRPLTRVFTSIPIFKKGPISKLCILIIITRITHLLSLDAEHRRHEFLLEMGPYGQKEALHDPTPGEEVHQEMGFAEKATENKQDYHEIHDQLNGECGMHIA